MLAGRGGRFARDTLGRWSGRGHTVSPGARAGSVSWSAWGRAVEPTGRGAYVASRDSVRTPSPRRQMGHSERRNLAAGGPI
jgi:hypothetical protein